MAAVERRTVAKRGFEQIERDGDVSCEPEQKRPRRKHPQGVDDAARVISAYIDLTQEPDACAATTAPHAVSASRAQRRGVECGGRGGGADTESMDSDATTVAYHSSEDPTEAFSYLEPMDTTSSTVASAPSTAASVDPERGPLEDVVLGKFYSESPAPEPTTIKSPPRKHRRSKRVVKATTSAAAPVSIENGGDFQAAIAHLGYTIPLKQEILMKSTAQDEYVREVAYFGIVPRDSTRLSKLTGKYTEMMAYVVAALYGTRAAPKFNRAAFTAFTGKVVACTDTRAFDGFSGLVVGLAYLRRLYTALEALLDAPITTRLAAFPALREHMHAYSENGASAGDINAAVRRLFLACASLGLKTAGEYSHPYDHWRGQGVIEMSEYADGTIDAREKDNASSWAVLKALEYKLHVGREEYNSTLRYLGLEVPELPASAASLQRPLGPLPAPWEGQAAETAWAAAGRTVSHPRVDDLVENVAAQCEHVSPAVVSRMLHEHVRIEDLSDAQLLELETRLMGALAWPLRTDALDVPPPRHH